MEPDPRPDQLAGSSAAAPESAGRREPPRRWLSADVALAGSAAVCVLLGWLGLLLVVHGRVLPWSVLVVVLSLAALLVGVPHRRRRASFVRASTVAVSGLALGVGLVSTAYASVVSSYLLHPAASPQGCRVVVLEESWFVSGGGAVYVLRGETGVARRAGRFTTDDGETPFSSGAAELEWYGEAAVVTGPLWTLPGEDLDVRC